MTETIDFSIPLLLVISFIFGSVLGLGSLSITVTLGYHRFKKLITDLAKALEDDSITKDEAILLLRDTINLTAVISEFVLKIQTVLGKIIGGA